MSKQLAPWYTTITRRKKNVTVESSNDEKLHPHGRENNLLQKTTAHRTTAFTEKYLFTTQARVGQDNTVSHLKSKNETKNKQNPKSKTKRTLAN